LEEAGIDLTKHISDSFGFFGELYRERVLELGGKVRDGLDAEDLEVA
jgi:hypothetical protein